MPRDFNGSSDYLTGTPGALVGMDAGPITLAAIISLDTTTDDGAFIYCGSGTESGVDLEIFGGSFYMGSQDPALATASTADGWHLIAATKAAGTATPRFHKYVYSSNTHTHTNAGSTQSDGVAVGSGDTLQIGRWGTASDRINGQVAQVAVWDRVLTDGEIEQLAFTLQAWYASAPKALLVLDQSTASTNVPDLTGGGANITGGTGTTVAANSVPVFSYGFEVPGFTDIAAAGGAVAATGVSAAVAASTVTATKTAKATGSSVVAAATTVTAAKATAVTAAGLPVATTATTVKKNVSVSATVSAIATTSATGVKTAVTSATSAAVATATATLGIVADVTGAAGAIAATTVTAAKGAPVTAGGAAAGATTTAARKTGVVTANGHLAGLCTAGVSRQATTPTGLGAAIGASTATGIKRVLITGTCAAGGGARFTLGSTDMLATSTPTVTSNNDSTAAVSDPYTSVAAVSDPYTSTSSVSGG